MERKASYLAGRLSSLMPGSCKMTKPFRTYEQSTIHAFLLLRCPVQIVVKTDRRKTINLHLEEDDTIKHVKTRIHAKSPNCTQVKTDLSKHLKDTQRPAKTHKDRAKTDKDILADNSETY
ncbi:hypothetical protein CHS0354_020463 [Potamilus streckersoni]|uniref:Uncharacterized protein n=1 Tax=Potamilus streckersoni TaxID=2493646 RepID=A0AAE0W9G8_9BIVA|nr:hypothetical protein CHS0354_020463 [Potamilus streckersoni]